MNDPVAGNLFGQEGWADSGKSQKGRHSPPASEKYDDYLPVYNAYSIMKIVATTTVSTPSTCQCLLPLRPNTNMNFISMKCKLTIWYSQ